MKQNQDAMTGAVTLDNAYESHQEWKEKLHSAVKAQETIDTFTIARDDCCDLGKWLYADGQRLHWGKPEFQSLLMHHKEFHLLAGAVAEVINQKQYELAEAYLSSDTQLAHSSNEVGAAIRRLEATVRG
jgi:hypothetical protein